jgi:hypothetical protein
VKSKEESLGCPVPVVAGLFFLCIDFIGEGESSPMRADPLDQANDRELD